jgi:hypothetical protein
MVILFSPLIILSDGVEDVLYYPLGGGFTVISIGVIAIIFIAIYIY